MSEVIDHLNEMEAHFGSLDKIPRCVKSYCDHLSLMLTSATARAEKAEKHCREHHLEPCETCMVTESDLIAVTAERDGMKATLEDAMYWAWQLGDVWDAKKVREYISARTAPDKSEVCRWKQVASGIGKEAPWTKYKIGCTTNKYISIEEKHRYCHECSLPIVEEKE